MFGKKIHLFTILGFSIGIDASWFFLVVIVTWSLATGVFPQYHPDLSTRTHWAMGVAGAIGLFVSIVLHELAHSVVARRHGVVMRGITLFIFGGVAEMGDEPPDPTAELQVAVAGPIASLVVALAAWLLVNAGGNMAWTAPATGVLGYLALINVVLVLFNMIPAFPLDGGRVLRAILWRRKGSLTQATRTTSKIGVGFSFFLIAVGVVNVVWGNFVGGLWYFLIGMFLRMAANMSYQQIVVRRALEGEKVHRFMQSDIVTVPPDTSIQSLVDHYIYRYHYKMFPVVGGERLIGCITTRQVKALDRDGWAQHTVGELAEPCSSDNSIAPDEDATRALSQMSRSGYSRLLVVEGHKLVGVITLKDLLRFLTLKVELEGTDG